MKLLPLLLVAILYQSLSHNSVVQLVNSPLQHSLRISSQLWESKKNPHTHQNSLCRSVPLLKKIDRVSSLYSSEILKKLFVFWTV